jgi:hypothetical protein
VRLVPDKRERATDHRAAFRDVGALSDEALELRCVAPERDDKVDVALTACDAAVVGTAQLDRSIDDGLEDGVEIDVVRAIVWITSRTAASRSLARCCSRRSSATSYSSESPSLIRRACHWTQLVAGSGPSG